MRAKPIERRDPAVAPAAVEALLGLLERQGVDLARCAGLVNAAICAPYMRDFKLDVSMSLRPGSAARVSVNDTGEPAAFRSRLRTHRGLLGISSEALEGFLALCPAGVAQTTVALKWEQAPRTSLYFEELARHPDADSLRDQLFATYCAGSGTPMGRPLMALAVDFVAGRPVALKEYAHVDLVREPQLLPELAALLVPHPKTGQKRALLTQRYRVDGAHAGTKLLWVTEANKPALAARRWQDVARIVRRQGLHQGRPWQLLVELIEHWRFGHDCVPYPDLVCFNLGPDGSFEDLILYVSLK